MWDAKFHGAVVIGEGEKILSNEGGYMGTGGVVVLLV